MKPRFAVAAAAMVLALSAPGFADTLKGTVMNLTTGKPAAGNEVVLLSLSGAMKEVGRAHTDAAGRFRVNLADTHSPTLVRVVHQGIGYQMIAQPGAKSVEVAVYDVSKTKLEGIVATVDMQRYQAKGDTLGVLEMIVLRNVSAPPHTLMNDRTFEVYLPEEAQVVWATARSGKGQAVTASLVPGQEKGHYYFKFPILPGETRFQIAYQLPYKGEKLIRPRVTLPLGNFIVALPKSMKFESKNAGIFQTRLDDPEASVQITSQLQPGRQVSFRISGIGTLSGPQGSVGPQQGGAQATNRPGGDLRAPVATPGPMRNFRWYWYILGGFALALLAGGVYFARRRAKSRAGTGERVAAAALKAPLLDALKEELFQLELGREQGRISPEEYQPAKAALDLIIRRAIARSHSKPSGTALRENVEEAGEIHGH